MVGPLEKQLRAGAGVSSGVRGSGVLVYVHTFRVGACRYGGGACTCVGLWAWTCGVVVLLDVVVGVCMSEGDQALEQ